MNLLLRDNISSQNVFDIKQYLELESPIIFILIIF